MISVVVPNLNEELHLPFFLSSLAQQSWRSFELVIVDGGSTDSSREIIDEYAEAFDLGLTKLINIRRNLGFIRNFGARVARGGLLLFTNSDAVLPESFIGNIAVEFAYDRRLIALSGRTIPLDGGLLCWAGYYCFDLLRALFSRIGLFSPSGNFLAIRADVFWRLGGFPEIKVNEDGHLGQRISQFARASGYHVKFCWRLAAGHYAKRFKKGGLKTLLFYTYVFGNFNPILKKLLRHIEKKSSREFDRK